MSVQSGKELISLSFGPLSNHTLAHVWASKGYDDTDEASGTGDEVSLLSPRLFRAVSNRTGSFVRATPRAVVCDFKDSAGFREASKRWEGGGAGSYANPSTGNQSDGHYGAGTDPFGMPSDFSFGAGAGAGAGGSSRYGEESSGYPYSSSAGSSGSGSSAPASTGPSFGWGSCMDRAGLAFHPHCLLPLGSRTATGDSIGSALASSLTSTNGSFDAFTDGAALFDEESLLEPLRWQLEDCDSPQGVVCVVDVDSGWGSLASAYLEAARDSLLPKKSTGVVVFGIAGSSIGGPSSSSNIGGTAPSYAARARATMSLLNLSLGCQAFGGSTAAENLDCTFVPLGYSSSSLSPLSSSSPFLTAAQRQALAVSTMIDTVAPPVEDEASKGSTVAVGRKGGDRPAGLSREQWDDSLERATDPPAVQLDGNKLVLSDLLALLSADVASECRLATVRMSTAPLEDKACLSATSFLDWATNSGPKPGSAVLLPSLSWADMTAGSASSTSSHRFSPFAPPIGHVAVLRGGQGLLRNSTRNAWGKALDRWLWSYRTPVAGHRLLAGNGLGARVGSCALSSSSAALPASSSLLLHASSGPDASLLLSSLAARIKDNGGGSAGGLDRSVLHRYSGSIGGSGGGASYGGAGPLDLNSLRDGILSMSEVLTSRATADLEGLGDGDGSGSDGED